MLSEGWLVPEITMVLRDDVWRCISRPQMLRYGATNPPGLLLSHEFKEIPHESTTRLCPLAWTSHA
jgi:hypothetical protein